MLFIPQKKHQYALRAIYELAKREGSGPIKIQDIAEAQVIPRRFLEVILHQLKGSGIIDSKRGFYGGYFITRSPAQITVGEIFRFMDKPMRRADCGACMTGDNCPFKGGCAFSPMWNKIRRTVFEIFDETTIQNLIDNRAAREAMISGEN
jgi:Rrf2 family transcriptional regulator, cysteine metabolism repressor